jgi:hypothetical protein
MEQDCGMADKQVVVSQAVDADPEHLYDLVADLSRMGRWSPEATGGKWVGAATGPALGARFHGNNRAGWRRWSTSCEVTAADPGRRFAFHVSFGPVPIADWSYEFLADGGATTVTEQWNDRRPGWMDAMSGLVMGVPDRAVHNRATMKATLEALKSAAESSEPSGQTAS